MVNVIDYVPGDTLLHRLNPVTKLGIAAAIIISIFLADTYPMLLGLLVLTFALGAYAHATSKLVSLAQAACAAGCGNASGRRQRLCAAASPCLPG